ncbi:helix-turn-helix domain-containing protein [Virgibacillus dakarensis]|nr:helix-turn-helix domain-containing protein [Virgibacillus dakarensis]MBT2215953.1 helix-turn-helix domain-containing protein [Virgibacillus dakarensis]
MNEKELRKFIGKRLNKFRKDKNLTQKELGDKIGVQNNTVSAYERGAASLDQDMLFKLSDILDVKVDDFFPEKQNTTDEFERALKMTDDLDLKDMEFLNSLIEKTLSKQGEEREKFLESIRFTVDYHENMNKK